MIFVEQINGVLEGLISGSLAVILEASSKIVKELFKFIIILLLLYYFAIWSFQFLDAALQEVSTTSSVKENQNDLNTLEDLVAHQIVGETCLRIGPPDKNLIKQRASLLEQLEIEAEFEENQDKLIKSEADLEQFVKKEIHTDVSKIRDSDDITPAKDYFISQIKQEQNEISRASQTTKTSLGKKSKLKEKSENRPTTSKGFDNGKDVEQDLISKFETNKVKEILMDQDSSRGSGADKTNRSNKDFIKKEEITYFDDQYDHESFHRV